MGSHLSINPGMSVRVEPGTRGFFIAGSNEEIKRYQIATTWPSSLTTLDSLEYTFLFLRAYYYCEICHKDFVDLSKIKKCKCHKGKSLSLSRAEPPRVDLNMPSQL